MGDSLGGVSDPLDDEMFPGPGYLNEVPTCASRLFQAGPQTFFIPPLGP